MYVSYNTGTEEIYFEFFQLNFNEISYYCPRLQNYIQDQSEIKNYAWFDCIEVLALPNDETKFL